MSAASLRDASVQEIQLELIRRTRFNTFDGEAVVAKLLQYRALWLAVLLDRPGVPDRHEWGLPTAGLIKLRDLPQNVWNADTLFVLTDGHEKARQFVRAFEAEEWGGMVQVYDDTEMIDRALGTGRKDYGVVTVWWD